jgi:hypothetical protein
LEPFPQRVQAVFGGETMLDTTSGTLLHEPNPLPQLYPDPLPDTGWLGSHGALHSSPMDT